MDNLIARCSLGQRDAARHGCAVIDLLVVRFPWCVEVSCFERPEKSEVVLVLASDPDLHVAVITDSGVHIRFRPVVVDLDRVMLGEVDIESGKGIVGVGENDVARTIPVIPVITRYRGHNDVAMSLGTVTDLNIALGDRVGLGCGIPCFTRVAITTFLIIDLVFQTVNAGTVEDELGAAALDAVDAVLIAEDLLLEQTAGAGWNQVNTVLPANAELLPVAGDRLNVQHRLVIDGLPARIGGLSRVLGHNGRMVGAGTHIVRCRILGVVGDLDDRAVMNGILAPCKLEPLAVFAVEARNQIPDDIEVLLRVLRSGSP